MQVMAPSRNKPMVQAASKESADTTTVRRDKSLTSHVFKMGSPRQPILATPVKTPALRKANKGRSMVPRQFEKNGGGMQSQGRLSKQAESAKLANLQSHMNTRKIEQGLRSMQKSLTKPSFEVQLAQIESAEHRPNELSSIALTL